MTIETAIQQIKQFWKSDQPLPFGQSDNTIHIGRLTKEFSTNLPDDAKNYIQSFAPLQDFYFDAVGNPIRIYGIDNLRYIQDGYNFNSVTNSVINNWPNNWFMFADEGADPILIDLENTENGIQKLQHGAGSWDYGSTVADNFGQFILCCAAQHHALNNFEEEPFVDDENGFCLADDAAKWYFPKMKEWAGKYYEQWCADLDNR